MNKLEAWLRSKNLSAHSIAVALIAAATAITTDSDVRNFVLGFFEAHPKIGTAIVTVAGIILKYSHSSSAAGTVATAKAIEASPDAPTAVDVAKATTK